MLTMMMSNEELYNHIMTNIHEFLKTRIAHLKTLQYHMLSRITLLNFNELIIDRELNDITAG